MTGVCRDRQGAAPMDSCVLEMSRSSAAAAMQTATPLRAHTQGQSDISITSTQRWKQYLLTDSLGVLTNSDRHHTADIAFFMTAARAYAAQAA